MSEEGVPGPNLTYGGQVEFGVVTSRKEIIISPKYGGEFRAGSIVRLEIPAQDYVDPDFIRLSFRSYIYAGAGNNWVSDVGHVPLASTSGIPWLGDERLVSSNANCNKTVKFKPGVQCIFNRVKVLAGSTTIEDIQDYGDLQRFFYESLTSKEWRENEGLEKEGFYDPEDVRQSVRASNHHSQMDDIIVYSANTYVAKPFTYTVRPFLGLLRGLGKIIPVKYIGNITFEFYLEENAQALWSTSSARVSTQHYAVPAVAPVVVRTASAPATAMSPVSWGRPVATELTTTTNMFSTGVTGSQSAADALLGCITTDFPNAYYVIDKVELIVPFLTVEPAYDSKIMSVIESTGLDLNFSTFHTHIKQISSVGRQNLNFTERSMSVKGGYVIMKSSDDIRDIRGDNTFIASNLQQYQWKIGNEYYPPQVVECTDGAARAYDQLKIALGTFLEYRDASNIKDIDYHPSQIAGNVMTQDPWELKRCASQPSKFAIGVSLEKSPGQQSGFDSAAAGVDIELQMTFGTQASRFAGTYAANRAFLGNFGSGIFPPSKFKVSLTSAPSDVSLTNVYHTRNEYYGQSDRGGIVVNKNTLMNELNSIQPGFMVTKGLTSTLTWTGTTFVVAGPPATIPVFSGGSEVGKYLRLAFYANVDTVLRIRRVGQIEVVV